MTIAAGLIGNRQSAIRNRLTGSPQSPG